MLPLKKSKDSISSSKSWLKPKLALLRPLTRRARRSIRAKLSKILYRKSSLNRLESLNPRTSWELNNWCSSKLMNRLLRLKTVPQWRQMQMCWIMEIISIIRSSLLLERWKTSSFRRTSSKSRRKTLRRRSWRRNSSRDKPRLPKIHRK